MNKTGFVKRIFRNCPALFIVVLFFFPSGCQTGTEPITGRSQFILVSPEQESRMGMEAWRKLIKENEQTENRHYQQAVERVGGHIAKAVDREYSGFSWEFRVFKSDQANAFCLPGGRVGVYDGLFKHLENDAELAVVLGHEIAHAVARHGAERMTQAMLINLGAIGLSAAMDNEEERKKERWILAYSGVTTFGYLLPYSRQHEYAADHLGMIFMARAGYDPAAAVSFWQRFADDENALSGIQQYLSTHPVGSERIKRLRSILFKAKLEYEVAPIKRNLGLKTGYK